jgi:hypothetical protein
MYGVIGTNTPSYLVAKAHDGDRIAVSLEPGNGEIARGTVLYKKSNGMYAPAAAADAVITKMLVILDETKDTGAAPESGDTAIADAAAAYRAGHFVDGTVKLKAGAELTDAVKVVLRAQGIVFEPMEGTEVFDNTVTGE